MFQNKRRKIDPVLKACEVCREAEQIKQILKSAKPLPVCSPVQDGLECPICNEQFKDPRVVRACGHTFCWGCIQKDAKVSGIAYRCPTCRKKDKHEPVVNWAIKDIVDRLEQYECPCCSKKNVTGQKTYNRDDLLKHLKKCPNRPRFCSVPGCKETFLPVDMEKHSQLFKDKHLELFASAHDDLKKYVMESEHLGVGETFPFNRLEQISPENFDSFVSIDRGIVDAHAVCVPSDEYPDISSAISKLRNIPGTIKVKPGLYREALNIASGHVTIMGTVSSSGEPLTKIISNVAMDTVHVANMGTKVVLVDLDIRQNADIENTAPSFITHEAVSGDEGCEIHLVRCALQSKNGPCVSVGLSTAAPLSSTRFATPTILSMHSCVVNRIPGALHTAVHNAMLLTGRFKVSLNACHIHACMTGVMLWLAPWDRGISTVDIKNCRIVEFKNSALHIKYEQFVQPFPPYYRRNDENFAVFTVGKTEIDSSRSVNKINKTLVVELLYKDPNGDEKIAWLNPQYPEISYHEDPLHNSNRLPILSQSNGIEWY